MAIPTPIQLYDYVWVINYDGSSSAQEVIHAIANCINGNQGWTATYDNLTASCTSPTIADRNGATSTKYCTIYNSGPYVYFKVTKDGTNYIAPHCTNQNLIQQYYAIGQLYLYISPYWLLGLSYRSDSGVWGSSYQNTFCGCVELTRDNYNDTVAGLNLPPVGWASGSTLGSLFSNTVFSFVQYLINPSDQDGGRARIYTEYGGGRNGNSLVPLTIRQLMPPYRNESFYKNPWNDTLFCSDISVGASITSQTKVLSEIRGRIIGLKAGTTESFAQSTYNDLVQIPTNPTTFLFDKNAVPMNHLVLPINDGQATQPRFYIPCGIPH
jgi:hypothetical protein